MGSPISSLFADIVMEDLEVECLSTLKDTYNIIPSFFIRYIDDIVCCVHYDDVSKVLEVFNNYDDNLKFTFESENNKTLNFLDISIIRQNNVIITNWFQKESNSTRLLNFNSHHTPQLKRNIIFNLVDRAVLLSDKFFHKENIKKVKTLLIKNQYPKKFIDVHINERLRHIFKNHTVQNNTQESQPLISLALPYKQCYFNHCKRSLKKFGVNVLPQLNNKLDVIKLGKDKISNNEKTGVVYKFNCDSCDSCYVGETKRKLTDRLKEHEKPNKKLESVVSKHCEQNPTHKFDFRNTKILDNERNFTKRRISEMIHIKSSNNTVNKKEDTVFLSNIYNPICDRLSKTYK